MLLDPPDTASPATHLAIDIRRCPWIRPLAADYAHDFGKLAPFFAGNPREPRAWSEAIARVLRGEGRDRGRLAAILAAQQDRRGAPPEARAASVRLADPRSVAILTGQQAGLFGGPLYTLLKALTALKLAERVAAEHDVPAVAVFWVESEDHDWTEVRSCAVLDADGHRRTVALGTPPGAGDVPVASVVLDASLDAAMQELRAALPPTEFTDGLLAQLADAYRPGAGMSAAFARWLERLLGRFGLVVYDGSDPDAKPLASGVFARELQLPGATTALALERGTALVERGYRAQVVPRSDSVALFYVDEGRKAIHFREGQFVVGDTTGMAPSALVEMARDRPGRFSPNVLLRPIVQDTLFPTVCYVAGPNELAYLAQLKPIYSHFGVPAPLMYPRATVTVIDAAAAKFLARYGVALESLQPDTEATLNRLLEDRLPAAVEAAFDEASRATDSAMARLVEAVPSVDPTLEGAVRSAIGRMQHELEALHDKIIHAAKRRDDTLRRQYARTRAQAFPDGQPQERALGSIYFLNRHGLALVDRLRDALPLDVGTHWVLTI